MIDISETEGTPSEPESPPSRVTLKQQWWVVAVVLVGTMVLNAIDLFFNTVAYYEGGTTAMVVVGTIAVTLGQAMWITMDRNRLGLEIGWWRFGAILIGIVFIPLHIIFNYRLRALYLVPVYFGLIAIYIMFGVTLEVVFGDWAWSRVEP